MNADTVLIAMGIALGIVIIFGIYKLATSSLHERSALKPGTSSSNAATAIRTLIAIIITILLFVGLYIAYEALS